MFERYDLQELLREIAEDSAKLRPAASPHMSQEEIRALMEEKRPARAPQTDEKS